MLNDKPADLSTVLNIGPACGQAQTQEMQTGHVRNSTRSTQSFAPDWQAAYQPSPAARMIQTNNALTSNLTGLATIGVNDFLCLDPDGEFHLVASDLEISRGDSALSGTPEQLTKLSITHPYAGKRWLPLFLQFGL
jgi:hypothetical protein